MKKILGIFLILAFFMLGERIVSKGLFELVGSSQFRFSKLYSGRIKTDVAIFGNSRALHSLYAPELNYAGCYESFQMSYNGLSVSGVENLIYDYIDRNSKPKVIILEVSVLYSDGITDQQLSIFSRNSKRLKDYLNDLNSSFINWNLIFSLLDYNNEMLARSLVYINKTDQNWINQANGAFVEAEESSEKREFVYDSSRIDVFDRLQKYISARSIELILYAAPYHSSISQAVQNPFSWDSEISFSDRANTVFFDFRKMPLENESYTDYLHTNIKGARSINNKIDEELTKILRCKND